MKLATYNIEWFNKLFGADGELLDDNGWSGRRDVTRAEQITALGTVFKAMDADGVMVVEAPDQSRQRDTVYALEGFAARFGLRARAAAIGFANDTQQEIAFLYDPDVMTAHHDPAQSANAPRFDTEIRIDLDVDAQADTVVWSKPPLELMVEAQGKTLRLIGVHAKSKAPHGAKGPADAMRISIANRRKQLAQCIWLRRRVEAHLEDGDALLVMGDFNDGPGLDEYEKLFGRSGVEIVLGENAPRLFDPHAAQALTTRFAVPTTSRFWLRRERRFLQALLDYIMVSADLKPGAQWRIWHPFEDVDCFNQPELKNALLTASDHFPVTIELDL